jgi:hypothetical protein
LVARSAGGREVAGSNPVTPIFYARILLKASGIFYLHFIHTKYHVLPYPPLTGT